MTYYAQQLANAVVDVLSRNVTDVVMSPGSRNSPLAYALLARRDIRAVSYTHLTLPTILLV